MKTKRELLEQYDTLVEKMCEISPDDWNLYIVQFTELRDALVPFAEADDMRCQYVLAVILVFGFLLEENDPELHAKQELYATEGSFWLEKLAAKGMWGAVDNLITSGVGPQADKLRLISEDVKNERPDLVPWSGGMPCYGPDFMMEVTRRCYGHVLPLDWSFDTDDAS